MANRRGKGGNSFPHLGLPRITVDSDCSHEIRRRWLLGRKAMTNLDRVLKSRDITLPTKSIQSRLRSFPWSKMVVESWTIKKAVQVLSCVRLFVTPWTAATQASLCITNSWSLLNFMSIKSVMPSNHLILCHPLLLPSVFPSIRVFSNGSVLLIRWPKYWSFSFSVSPSNEYSELFDFL